MGEGDLAHHLFAAANRSGGGGECSGEPLPGEDGGAEEEEDRWLGLLEDDADQEEVDEELEGGVKEPPDVPQQRVCPLVSDLGDCQIPDEPATLYKSGEALKDGADTAAARPTDGQLRTVGGHERARIAPVPPILPLTRPRLKEDH